MAREIDERVVEMRFDNKEFESKCKQSISTLDKLKKSLDLSGAAKGMDELEKTAKDFKIDGILSSVKALEDRFSTLGIVGMRIIENITDALVNKLASVVNFASDAIVSGGIRRAMNIENAHFQLQALLKDEAEVQAVMDNAMESVDGTAYAYDEAAKAASQFAASGIQAGEEMLQALKGITGVAAMTNSDFESISRIFTTVAGNGRLMGDQLLQLSSRGLNAASTIAQYFKEVRGQAKVTEADIREMVSKGELDFKTFSDAMTYAFGDSAKRANETFTGALSNVKSALARIGAGFISPLVEQNSELVNFFNAVRIKVNELKSALVFDEQISAISGMSKQAKLMVETVEEMTRDGKIEFTKFTDAILKTNKSEKELTEINERLSESYNKVKENGTLTKDVLSDFNKEGLRATGSIMNFINGVLDGTIKVSSTMRQAVIDITGGNEVVYQDVIKLTEEGKISYDLFASSIINSSGLMAQGSEIASDAVKELMNSIKEAGTVSSKDLNALAQNGLLANKAIYDYIKGVEQGTINTTYALRTEISGLTDENGNLLGSVTKLANEGKLSYSLLQAAMEEAYGDQRALSKQFTDFFLDKMKSIVNFVQNLDLSRPMEVFYYWVESVKHVLSGFFSVLKPIGEAFSEIFLSSAADDILNISTKIEEFTAKLKSSDKSSKNLKDTFKGLFSLVKLGADLLIKLVKAIFPVSESFGDMGEGLLGLTGDLGRALSKFTEWVRTSAPVQQAFSKVGNAIRTVVDSLKWVVKGVSDYISKIASMETTQRIWSKLKDVFVSIGRVCLPYLEKLWDIAGRLASRLAEMIPVGIEKMVDGLASAFDNFANSVENIDFSGPSNALQFLKDKLSSLLSIFTSNEGISTYFSNFSKYLSNIGEGFSFKNIFGGLTDFREKFEEFVSWLKERMGPLSNIFDDVSFGGIVATAGGFGLLGILNNLTKAFSDGIKKLNSLPNLLGTIGDTLKAYQNKLKAEQLKDLGKAILMLAAALILLSFADTKKVAEAAVALGALGGALSFGGSKLIDSLSKVKTASDALNEVAKGFKWKLIGKFVKDLGESILLIAGAIALLAYTYNKDPEAYNAAVKLVETIGAAIAAIIVIMNVVNNKLSNGAKNTKKACDGILEICIALYIAVAAVNKLFKINIPADYKKRLEILALLFAGLIAVVIAVNRTSKVVDKSQVVKGGSSGSILALAAFLYLSVSSVNKLFKIEIPADYETKLAILAGLFIGLGYIAKSIGKASSNAKGALKAGGTILAMTIFMGAAVLSLAFLNKLDGEKLTRSAIIFGALLLVLSESIKNASKNGSSKGDWKNILAMAAMAAVTMIALGVLSMVDTEKLLSSAIALGLVLFALSKAFENVENIKVSKKSLKALGAMLLELIVIAAALYQVGKQPWSSILAAGVAMKLVLDSVMDTLSTLSKKTGLHKEKVEMLLAIIVGSIIPIAIALGVLAFQPWDNLLGAAGALSLTLLAFSEVLKIISSTPKKNLDVKVIGLFLLATLAVFPIGAALFALAEKPWDGLLAAAASLSLVLIAVGAVFAICATFGSSAKEAALGLAALLVVIPTLAAVTIALYVLSEQPVDGLIAAAEAIGLVMAAMLVTLGACTLAGLAAPAALAGIGVLTATVTALTALLVALGAIFEIPGLKEFLDTGAEIMIKIGQTIGEFIGSIISGAMVTISEGLPVIADNLSLFAAKLQPFIILVKNVNSEVVSAVGRLLEVVLMMTAAELLSGINSFLSFITGGSGFDTFAEQLNLLIPGLMDFASKTEGLNVQNVERAAGALKTLLQAFHEVPNSGGLLGMIVGNNDISSSYAKKMASMGEGLAKFSENVTDNVNYDNVDKAAGALVTLFNAFKQIPNSGGLVGMIVGNNDISKDYADKMAAMGEGLANFSENVQDNVDYDQVSKAAQAMIDLFNAFANIPNSGGLLGAVVGNNDISEEYADSIGAMGEALSNFSSYTSLVDTSKVSASVDVLNHMFSVFHNIPNSGGIISWFTGDNDLETFGESLEEFGESLYDYYDWIKDIQFSDMEAAVRQITSLANVDKMFSSSSFPLVDFLEGLTDIGPDSINEFITAFSDCEDTVGAAVTTMMTKVVDILDLYHSEFTNQGTTDAENWASGLSSMSNATFVVVTGFINKLLSAFENSIERFGEEGTASGQAYIDRMVAVNAFNKAKILADNAANGIRHNLEAFTDVGKLAGQGYISGLDSNMSAFTEAGVSAVQGFINGINDHLGDAAAAGTALGNAALNAAKAALDAHSPAKKFIELGGFGGKGMVIGLSNWIIKVAKAGTEIGEAAVDSTKESLRPIKTILSDDIYVDPVIRPTVDTSEIEKSADEICRLFNNSVATMTVQADSISGNMTRIKQHKEEIQREFQNKGKESTKGDTYNVFNQTNTSPKALSRIEIYRQTNNLFSKATERIGRQK